MSRFELIPFDSDVALANAVVAACVAEIVASPPGRRFCLALSGGRIAQRFFLALADEVQKRKAKLDCVHFFWADERCVSAADPESNFGVAQKLLFSRFSL